MSQVLMLGDGRGIYAIAFGLESDLTAHCLGHRCERFSMVVSRYIVKQVYVDERTIAFTSADRTCDL